MLHSNLLLVVLEQPSGMLGLVTSSDESRNFSLFRQKKQEANSYRILGVDTFEIFAVMFQILVHEFSRTFF
jgi:hypothetical protein